MITSNIPNLDSMDNVKAKVDFFNGSTLAATCNCGDYLENFEITREGDNSKFFGFGVCHKLDTNLVDLERALPVTKDNTVEVGLGDGTVWDAPYPTFYISELKRDEISNTITVTAYDRLYNANDYLFSELGLKAPYTPSGIVSAIATKLGIGYLIPSNLMYYFNQSYAKANLEGSEPLRSVLNWIAEITQTIYYINHQNKLTFRRLSKFSSVDAEITKDDYYSLDTQTPRALTNLCATTALGDNIRTDNTAVGVTQYIRNNPFLELMEGTNIQVFLTDALSNMYEIANTQFDCAWVGNYLLEIGDKLAITQENDEVIEVFLISDTITFAGTLDEVSSWEFADEQTETYADPITIGERLNQTYARVNKMEKNIMLYVSDVVEEVVNDLVPPKVDEMTDSLYEDVADIKVSQATIESKVSQLELTTDNINQRVENTEKTVTTLEGTVESNKQEAIDESKDYTDTQLETVITTVTQIDSKVAELDITTEAIEQKVSTTEQKIVNIESSVDDAVTTVETMKTEVGAMKVTSDTVLATVSSVERKVTEVESKLEDADDVTNARIDSLARDVSLKLDKNGVEIAVESVLTEGVDKVVTASKKYTFDDQGLNVSSSDSEFSTMVTENGMTISKQNNEVLTVNNQGVQAADLHARTFLIIGENSRLEDRGRRTACFWIGPAGG